MQVANHGLRCQSSAIGVFAQPEGQQSPGHTRLPLRRPRSASFTGAFRRVRPGAGAPILNRPRSAPSLRQDAHSPEARSEWALLAKHQRQLSKVEKKARALRNREEELKLNEARYLQLVDQAAAGRHMLLSKKKELQAVELAFKQHKKDIREEAAEAHQRHLHESASLKGQIQAVQKQRELARTGSAQEKERERSEQARLASLAAAEDHEKKRCSHQRTMNFRRQLKDQIKDKELEARKCQEEDWRVGAEYAKLIDIQDAARKAKLKEMVDNVARKVAVNHSLQRKSRLLSDKALDDKVAREVLATQAAEDMKAQAEQMQRQQIQSDQRKQLQQQIRSKQRQLAKQWEEEKLYQKQAVAQDAEAMRQEKQNQEARRSKALENQQALLAQRTECRARRPVEMTDAERRINSTLLKEAMAAEGCHPGELYLSVTGQRARV